MTYLVAPLQPCSLCEHSERKKEAAEDKETCGSNLCNFLGIFFENFGSLRTQVTQQFTFNQGLHITQFEKEYIKTEEKKN
jgi:hypothetical protein